MISLNSEHPELAISKGITFPEQTNNMISILTNREANELQDSLKNTNPPDNTRLILDIEQSPRVRINFEGEIAPTQSQIILSPDGYNIVVEYSVERKITCTIQNNLFISATGRENLSAIYNDNLNVSYETSLEDQGSDSGSELNTPEYIYENLKFPHFIYRDRFNSQGDSQTSSISGEESNSNFDDLNFL